MVRRETPKKSQQVRKSSKQNLLQSSVCRSKANSGGPLPQCSVFRRQHPPGGASSRGAVHRRRYCWRYCSAGAAVPALPPLCLPLRSGGRCLPGRPPLCRLCLPVKERARARWATFPAAAAANRPFISAQLKGRKCTIIGSIRGGKSAQRWPRDLPSWGAKKNGTFRARNGGNGALLRAL